ncbi:MAG: hypothetical protein H6807_10815 [Planctomycetes bacterium]|nr:hypothetical protein [Planctomycetota bacterium]
MSESSTLRSRVLGLHLAFERMLPFVTEAKRISVNAQVVAARLGEQGKPYAAVVVELGETASMLEDLIGQVASSFRLFVRSVADMGQQELRLHSYQRTSARIDRFPPEPWRKPENLAAAQSKFRHAIRTERARLLDSVSELARRIRDIELIVDEIRTVASRRSRFVAFVAMLESTKVEGERSEIETVSVGIGDLAERLSAASEDLRKRVRDLDEELDKLVREGHNQNIESQRGGN